METSIRRLAARGVIWRAVTLLVVQGLQILSLLLLARSLSSGEMGLVAATVMMLEFGGLFCELGLTTAVIQEPAPSPAELSTIYWTLVASGTTLFSVLEVIGLDLMGSHPDSPIGALVAGTGAVFFAQSWGLLLRALLRKRLAFAHLFAVEASGAVVGTGVLIFSLGTDMGALSFIYGALAGTVLKSAVLLFSCSSLFLPSLRFKPMDLRRYRDFSFYEFAFSATSYLSGRLDQLMILLFLGPRELGAYFLAIQLVSFPQSRIGPAFTQVALPAFSARKRDEGGLRRGYLELVSVLALTSFPLLAGIAALSDRLVPLLYGPGWDETLRILPLLVPVGAVGAMLNPTGSLLYARGRADLMFRWSLGTAAATAILLACLTPKGLVWVAVGMLLRACAVFYLSKRILLDELGFEWRGYLAGMASPAVLSAAMACVVFAASRTLFSGPAGDPVSAILLVGLGAGVYAGTVAMLEGKRIKRWWGLLR